MIRRAISRFSELLATEAPDPEQHAARIWFMERNIGLPVKALALISVFYFLFFSRLTDSVTMVSMREVALENIQRFFLLYILVNVAAGIMLIGMTQLPLILIQWVVFTVNLLDGLFLSSLTLLPGTYDSVIFWMFPGLIIRNAISIPTVPWQLLVNFLITFGFGAAAVMDAQIDHFDQIESETVGEPLVLRIAILLLVTLCCYGVQVLFDRQRRTEDEAREFALRQEQLRVTSRLAAEIAHQLKNPLGIINNAAFNLQRNVKEGKATITQQIKIIREEVERSDRIITDMMGYSRLAEGRLERLNVDEALDNAIDQVFPAAVHYDIQIERDYSSALPVLLMQPSHLTETFVNILQNAREAMGGAGKIRIATRFGEGYSVIVTIEDSGPGIPPEIRDKVFEPYFTTKDRGTGLGLAIVKHNVEMYGGSVQVDSESGLGCRFVLVFPAKSLMKLRK
ncbi:MAG TPA: ATP-binding protein [Candidatus Paceibacterota bacterium]|nr:GHKL domain-containing protein [Verrucomicrobiota bacterium]HOX01592.1 ATP-binding protein [Verrucomicrobiota bacterium]HRZ44330.1 ATP-binding protein [Candidatus Paceibacterota bacterium]